MHAPRRRVTAAALLVVLAGAVPASAEDTGDALAQTQAELAQAEAELDQLLAQIDAVEEAVAAADARVAELQDVLAEVEGRLAEANASARSADAEVAAARTRLRAALAAANAAQTVWDEAKAAMEDRVAIVWIHGPGESAEVMLGGLMVAEDLHDVAVFRQASGRVIESDARLVQVADAAAAQAARLHSLADIDRVVVEAAAEDAHQARRDAEALVAVQQDVIARADAERASRAAALKTIEDDVAARLALIDRLVNKVGELRAASLDDWLREVQNLPLDGPTPAWASNLPGAGKPLARAIEHAAGQAGIDGRLFAALVWTESSFQPGAVSPSGAVGLAQLMAPTARDLGVDRHDPQQNLLGGARYLRQQLDRFGRVDLALAAYNAGPNRVARDGNVIPDIVETQLYVLRILDRWERLG